MFRAETMTEIAEKELKKSELDTDHSDLMAEMKKIHDKKDEKNKELKEKCKKWDDLQSKKDAATKKFDEIRKKDEALHAELVETNKRRKANMASLKTERSNLEELFKVPEKNAKDIEECESLSSKSAATLVKEEEALKKLMEGLREKTEPLLKERQEFETKLMSLRPDVDQAKAAYDLSESELKIYTSVEQIEKDKLQKLQESLESSSARLQERKQQIASFKNKIPATAKSLQSAQAELEDVKTREATVSGKLRLMRVQFEEQRLAMTTSKSRNRVINSLMDEKKAGRIPGIFGRLGDLGAIDAKYDVAISTACGPLDNVVVDTVETAQACLLFLRQNDIGRATFIPLNKQAHLIPQCKQRIQTPENVPRLFDLVKVEDERVLPAFYYGLRNTLVANDLNQATRIAYGAQRHRVVTLKGELIEISGTMSGGGKTVSRGRMGQSVVRSEPSTADVEKLQGDLDAVYEECNRLRARQQPLEEQIYTLSTALKDMSVDRDKYEIELKTLTDLVPSLKAQIKVQEKKAADAVSSPAKVKALTKAVEVAQANYERVKERSKETEDAVARISKEISDLSGGRVKEQQKKIAALTKTIDKAKAEIIRLQVAIKTNERNIKKTEQKIETLESDVENCEKKIREKQGEKKNFEEEAKGLLAKLEELNDALTERDEIGASYKEELNALTARESKMKALKIDLDQKISESDKVLKDLQKLIPEYTRRIAAMKLHEIPGEEIETLVDLTAEQVAELNSKNVGAQLQRAKQRLPEEIPNMQIIKDYQIKEAAYLKRASDLEEITAERNKLRDTHETARRRRCEEFLAGFTIITGKLKEMYQMITMDGDAELELVDSMDPFSEGIVFSVRPPKKSWKNISNLSGGEKTLSSLALVFALHHYKPSPVYFMDEIDAALDFKNISIIGNYIKERAKNTQFIVVSLRENMFELANMLVGIYKTYDATKTARINMRNYVKEHGGETVQMSGFVAVNPYSQVARSASQMPPRETVNGERIHSDTGIPATCPAQVERMVVTPTPVSPANVTVG